MDLSIVFVVMCVKWLIWIDSVHTHISVWAFIGSKCWCQQGSELRRAIQVLIMIRIGRWEECQRSVRVRHIQNRRWIIMRTRKTLIIQRTGQRWIIVLIKLIPITLRQRVNKDELPLETRGVCISYLKINRIIREYALKRLTITLIYAII